MKRLLLLLPVAAACLSPAALQGANTQARLVLSAATARPGETITAGLRLTMNPGWHTYWKNPGSSGAATKIEWQLPPGVTAGDIQWPTPEKLVPEKMQDGRVVPGQFDFEFTTYVYHGDILLLVPLTLAPDLPSGALELKAQVDWLECEKLCLPGDASVTARLEIGAASIPSADAALIETWRNKLPQPADDLSPRAAWEGAASGNSRTLVVEWSVTAKVGEPDFFPDAYDEFEVQHETEVLSAGPGTVRLRKDVKKLEGDWPKEIAGLLIQKSGKELQSYSVKLPVAEADSIGPAVSPLPGSQSVGRMLLYAFVGGMILNVMPCVLPVIALKILGFVSQAREEPRRVRGLGLVYGLGVLVSFLVLAGIVIGVKAAGQKAGWGMQFSNPQFIVVLTVLITLVALNLFGVFEITLSGGLMSSASGLAAKQGTSGAFFHGVLATVLATPCTAPFLGVALGFAFAQPTPMIVLMFLMVGAGLAAPYVVLSWQPAWLKFLPKPGPWMERFKVAMGFPMLATAVWLLNLTPTFYGRRVWWLGLFLVLVALAAWIFGEFFQRGRSRRGLALALALGVIIGGYAYAVEGQLQWRSPLPPDAAVGSLRESAEGIAWQRWSPEAVAEARAAGRPILVDFTADWCLTCQFNKKTSLEITSVRQKLKEINSVALLGDYTRTPPDITEELNRFGRAGVPLVLVYPRKAGEPPLVLPEALTPGIVLRALEQAAQ